MRSKDQHLGALISIICIHDTITYIAPLFYPASYNEEAAKE